MYNLLYDTPANRHIKEIMHRNRLRQEAIFPTEPMQFQHPYPLIGGMRHMQYLKSGNSPQYPSFKMSDHTPQGPRGFVGDFPHPERNVIMSEQKAMSGGKLSKLAKGFEKFGVGLAKVAIPIALGTAGTVITGNPLGGGAGVVAGRAIADEIHGGARLFPRGAQTRIGTKLGKFGEEMATKIASKALEQGVNYALTSAVGAGRKKLTEEEKALRKIKREEKKLSLALEGPPDAPKKPRKPNKWIEFVRTFHKPGVSWKDALILAKHARK